MKKRMAALLLSMAMCVTTLAGCGSEQKEESTSQVSTQENQSAEDKAAENGKEEMNLTIVSIISKDVAPNHEPVTKLLKEKFNIAAEWMDISETEQLNLLFSTGEYPDVIFNFNGETDIKRWATQGYLYSIDEYMDSLPNYRALYTDEEWNQTHMLAGNADGKLYYIPTKNYRVASEAWMYRMGMLEELGKEAPKTTDELYELLKVYKEKYPDAIPIANRWGLGNMLKGFELAFRTSSQLFFDPDSNQMEFGPATDKYREMLIYVAKLYGEGLIDMEFATATDTQWEEVYYNGLNIAEYSYTNRPEWANSIMAEADPDADWQWTAEYVTAYPEKEALAPKEAPYLAWGCVVTKGMSEEELQRWLEVVDWACTEEGLRWFSMGEEGVTYEMKEGVPTFLPDVYTVDTPEGKQLEELGYGYWLMRSEESLAPLGYADDAKLSQIVKDMDSREIVAFNMTEEQEKELVDPSTQVNDIYQEYALRFVTGSLDPANDSDWNEYIDKLEGAGLQKIMEIKGGSAAIVNK